MCEQILRGQELLTALAAMKGSSVRLIREGVPAVNLTDHQALRMAMTGMFEGKGNARRVRYIREIAGAAAPVRQSWRSDEAAVCPPSIDWCYRNRGTHGRVIARGAGA